MSLIEKAKEFAIKAHGDQKYGKMPYEYHLQQVVSKLLLWRDRGVVSISDEQIAAGWLHDVVEDCDVPYKILVDMFGEKVTRIVYLLTKNQYVPYQEYIHLMRNSSAAIVKVADTMCNLEASLYSGEIKRVNKYAKQLALLTE